MTIVETKPAVAVAAVTRVTIVKGRMSRGVRSRQLYHADLNGERIVENRHDVENAACRVLLARGITGTLVTRHAGETYDAMRLDIARGAGLTLRENSSVGPAFVKWIPREMEETDDACAD